MKSEKEKIERIMRQKLETAKKQSTLKKDGDLRFSDA